MPQPEIRRPRHHDARDEYYYRRPLAMREVLPAIGIGIGAGLFAFYVTRLLLQRAPLRPDPAARPGRFKKAHRKLP